MSRSEIQSLINKAPESWKKMFRRYGLSSKPTVSRLINTVLEYTPSMRSSGQKGKAIHKVPENIKNEAMEGIYLSWEHNYTSDSGIGLVRAMQLVVRDKIPDRSVKRMSSYFSRSKKGTPKQYMAWLNWGGDAGKKWADRISKKLRNPAKKGTRDSKGRFIPEKYLAGYKGKKRTERIKELGQRRTEYEKALKKYGDEDYFPQSVLDKLYRPFKTDKGVTSSKSPYTREAHRRGFTGSIVEKAKAASKYYGGKIDPDILDEVNDRGMAAWSSGGHRGGQTSHSWGVARVNSFLVGGKAFFTSDSDQADLLPTKVRKGIEREALHKPKKKNPKRKVSFTVDPFRPKNKGQKSRWKNHYYPFTNISVDVGGKDVWVGTISRRDFYDGDGLQEYVVLIFGNGYKSFKPDYTSHYSIPFGKLNAAALKQAKQFVKDFYAGKIDKKEFIQLWQHEANWFGQPERKESRRYNPKRQNRGPVPIRMNPNDRSGPINAWIKKGRAGSEIQALLFDKDYFTGRQARKWIKDHEFVAPKCHATKNFLRYRQADPDQFEKGSFRTITLTDGIKATVGIPRLYKNPKYPIRLVSPSQVRLKGFSREKTREVEEYLIPSLKEIEKIAGKRIKFPSPIYPMTKAEIDEGREIVDKGHPQGAGHGVFYPSYNLIKVNASMDSDEILANVIHENLHFAFPLATEIDVDKMVGILTYKILGYSTLGDRPI